MKLIATISILAALALASTASAAVTREFEGTVVSVDRSGKTFHLRDVERGTVRINVTSRTRFERVTFSSLRPGRGASRQPSDAPTAPGWPPRSSAPAAAGSTAAGTATTISFGAIRAPFATPPEGRRRGWAVLATHAFA
jgi:hypothetical protein